MDKEELMCLPQFYLIGHVKCGTSDLWAVASKHPDVNPGRVLKEQHYFSRPWITAHQWVDRYRRFSKEMEPAYAQFITRNAGNNGDGGDGGDGGGGGAVAVRVAGDATPDYIWANLRYLNQPFRNSRGTTPDILGKEGNITIAEVIAELNPKARLLLQLRDPVSRLWSDFFYFAHRPNHEREIPLPHPDTEVTPEHFDAFARRAIDVFNSCMRGRSSEEGTALQECTFATRTYKKYVRPPLLSPSYNYIMHLCIHAIKRLPSECNRW